MGWSAGVPPASIGGAPSVVGAKHLRFRQIAPQYAWPANASPLRFASGRSAGVPPASS
jgi:hypothetical protein